MEPAPWPGTRQLQSGGTQRWSCRGGLQRTWGSNPARGLRRDTEGNVKGCRQYQPKYGTVCELPTAELQALHVCQTHPKARMLLQSSVTTCYLRLMLCSPRSLVPCFSRQPQPCPAGDLVTAAADALCQTPRLCSNNRGVTKCITCHEVAHHA
jgi:hypothetical protein